MTARVLVVGGGLAGLSAAFELAGHAEVVLLEAAPRLGGQILTERRDGFTIERGAEGFVFRSTAVPALARELGLPEDAVIGQGTLRSYGWDGSALAALAPGEAATYLGFQVSREDLGKGIRTLRDGMGSAIDAFERALDAAPGVRVRRSVRVTALERTSQGVRAFVDDGSTAVVATPAAAAARLLGALLPEASPLAHAPVLSSTTVELAFEREAIEHPLDGTGFVIAERAQQEGLRACTFTSSKFAGRAPAGRVSLRLFFRPSADELATLDDAAWAERARRGLARVIGVRGEPLCSWVSRWPDALPVHAEPYKASVAALERAIEAAGLPLVLAGSAFHGSGIDAAVQSGQRAAERARSTWRTHVPA
jgi:oxygen-dependent protoporphyrinogen oxidase